MKVLKFGGSSVGSPLGRKNIREIALNTPEQTIIVVSALGGITDMLIAVAREAAIGNIEGYTTLFEAIKSRHLEAIEQSTTPQEQQRTTQSCLSLLYELSNLLKGVSLVNDLSPKSEAAIVAYGERLNSIIIASTIPEAKHIDSREIFKTTPYFGRHIIDFTLTNQLIRTRIGESTAKTIVIGGFISSDKLSGETTNLGRGGSDYTAAIIASTLEASELLIYTDVDGFMSADPRIIKEAELLDHLTFVEAMELCNFGAKVIYAPTIFPAYNSNVPIIIRNTFNLECQGTYISNRSEDNNSRATGHNNIVKGITSINDTALLTVNGLGRVGSIGINYRIFKALSKAGVSIILVSQNSSECSTNIAIRNSDTHRAVETLRSEFAQEIAKGDIDDCIVRRNLATVAVVGQNMLLNIETTKQIYDTLHQNGIKVITSTKGASRSSISFIVELSSMRRAIELLHSSLFRVQQQELNLYIVGTGAIKENLVGVISSKKSRVVIEKGVNINIVEGEELPNFCDKPLPSNPIVVDCTTSTELANRYEQFLSSGISIVSSNKIAASDEFENYNRLKESAKSRGTKFLYGTNVGAGLPIISTINALNNSGDKVTGIEALLSGSINFVLERVFNQGISFSEALKAAKATGLTEREIMEDLSGLDVARKLVILVRECGYEINLKNIKIVPIFKKNLLSLDDKALFTRLEAFDREFNERVREIKSRAKQLCYVATMRVKSEGSESQIIECNIEPKEVGFGNALYNIGGGYNLILLHSQRYREYPLQIKGYGAGVEATAKALFSDILSICK